MYNSTLKLTAYNDDGGVQDRLYNIIVIYSKENALGKKVWWFNGVNLYFFVFFNNLCVQLFLI